VEYTETSSLELWNIMHLLRKKIESGERSFLWTCYKVRTSMTHMKPAEPRFLTAMSAWWKSRGDRYPQSCQGWDWPRCGQSLTLLVGPSGAGKSTWAAANHVYEDIISSDAIGEELGIR
jgi:hypothetical protein